MNRSHPFVRAFALCALLIAAALAVAACGSSSSNSSGGGGGGGGSSSGSTKAIPYGTLPPVGTPSKGGTISFGQITGSTPTWIFPIIPGTNATSYTINMIQNLYLPLYNGPTGATPTINYGLSLADKPTYTDGGKTVTINMKTGYKWSDGKPVDAADMVFEIDLLKAAVKESPANWSQYTPGQFPTSVVSATAPSKYKLVMKLNKAYNPNYFLNNQVQDTNNVYPLPSTAWNIASAGGSHLDYTDPANAKKIYDYLTSQAKSLSGFTSNPLWKITDGPYKLKSFSPTNSSYVLTPNPTYGGGPGPYATIDVNTYTSITAQLNALQSGSLDVGGVDFSQLGAVPGLKSQGYSVFGGPSFGWLGAIINFKDTTGHFDKIIKQLYVRQALAHLVNQPAYIKGIFKNAAAPNYGPVPQVPVNPFTPDNNKSANGPYPYSPSQAVSLLKAHGWKVVPNGQTTCQKAGSGQGECGAGIPAGTPLKFNFVDVPQSQVPSSALEGQAFSSEAKTAAGINVQLESKTFNYQIANYDDADPSDKKNENTWAMANYGGFFYDYYPASEGVFNTGGVFNAGGFEDPQADKLMNESVFSNNPDAVKNEGAYLTTNFPVLFMPQSDYIYASAKKVGGNADGFGSLTQQSFFPQYWYLTK
jgi:peptide/nickel transport system substrate-binding protein